MDTKDYDFKKLFDKYCEEKKSYISKLISGEIERNRKIEQYSNMFALVNDPIDFKNVDNSVCRSGNENVKKFILGFYDYLLTNYNYVVYSKLKNAKMETSKLMRRLEIAKFLHTKPTHDDLIDEFFISSDTLDKDLASLSNGINFMGTRIKINKKRVAGDRIECDTTIHPIFLPLNLSEVYVLTKYLPKVLRDNGVHNDILNCIIDRVTNQLSDYALEKLDLHRRYDLLNDFNEEDLSKRDERAVAYALKSGCNCVFMIDDKEVMGKWKSFDKIKLEDSNKEIDVKNISDIEFRIDEK